MRQNSAPSLGDPCFCSTVYVWVNYKHFCNWECRFAGLSWKSCPYTFENVDTKDALEKALQPMPVLCIMDECKAMPMVWNGMHSLCAKWVCLSRPFVTLTHIKGYCLSICKQYRTRYNHTLNVLVLFICVFFSASLVLATDLGRECCLQ